MGKERKKTTGKGDIRARSKKRIYLSSRSGPQPIEYIHTYIHNKEISENQVSLSISLSTSLFLLGLLRLDLLWHPRQPVQEHGTGNVEDDEWPNETPIPPSLAIEGRRGG